jgi:hypothetical protein
MEKNRRWPSILRSTTQGDRRINGLTFGPGGRGEWAESAACSSDCGLRAQHEIFAERNIHGEEHLHVKFNLKIAKMCEIFPTLNMTLHMLCIAYKKVVVVKLKFKFL